MIRKTILFVMVSFYAFSQPYILEKLIDNEEPPIPPRKCNTIFSFEDYVIISGGIGFYENSNIRYALSDTWSYNFSNGVYSRICDGSDNYFAGEGEENIHFCINSNRCTCDFGCLWSNAVLFRNNYWVLNPATNYSRIWDKDYISNKVYFFCPGTFVWVQRTDPPWDGIKRAMVFSYKSSLWLVGGYIFDEDTYTYVPNTTVYNSSFGDLWNTFGTSTGISSSFVGHPAVFGFGVWLIGYEQVGTARISKVYYSRDCLSWEEKSTIGFPTNIGGDNHAVQVWDGKIFLLFSSGGVDYIYYSIDGINWTSSNTFEKTISDYSTDWFSTCVKNSISSIGNGILIFGGSGDQESGYPRGYSNDLWFLRECREGSVSREGTSIGFCDCSVGFVDMGVTTYTEGVWQESEVYVDISVSTGLYGSQVLEEGLLWGSTYDETYFYENYGSVFNDSWLIKIFNNKYNFYNITYYIFDECGVKRSTTRSVIVYNPFYLVNNSYNTYQMDFTDSWVDPGIKLMPTDSDVSADSDVFVYKSVNGVRTLLNVGGSSWSDSIVTSIINANNEGNYEAWYYYTDSCSGNLLVKRYITAYTSGAGLFLVGGTDFDIECSSYSEEESWSDSGVLALDDGGVEDEDAVITMIIFQYIEGEWVAVTTETSFDSDLFYSTYSGVVGEYKIEYHYTDSLLVEHTSIRIVNVVDNTPPEITLLGDSNVVINCGEYYVDYGAVPYLQCGNDLDVTSESNVDYTVVGNYTIEYNLQDEEGNNATEVIRNVSVVDNENPEIFLMGSEITEVISVNGRVPTEYYEQGYVAYDRCDGDITQNVTIDNGYMSSVSGISVGESYPVVYSVSDSSGNTVSKTRWMVVKVPENVNTGMEKVCKVDIATYSMKCYDITYSNYVADMFTLGEEGFSNFWISSGTFKVVNSDFYFYQTDGITTYIDKCIFVVYSSNKSYLFYAFLIGSGSTVDLKVVDACEISDNVDGIIKSILIDSTGRVFFSINTIDGVIICETLRENNLVNLQRAVDFQYSNSGNIMATTRYGFVDNFSSFNVPVGFRDKSSTGMYKINKWDWSFGTGEGSKDKNPMYVFKFPGVYNVRMSVATDFSEESLTKSVNIGVNLFKYGVLNKLEVRNYGKHNSSNYLEGYGATWEVESDDVVIPIVERSFPLRTTTYMVRGTVTLTLVPDSRWELYSASIKINGEIYNNNIGSNYSFNTGEDSGFVYEVDSYFESNND